MAQIHGVILDVDGTLIDSNDAQAQSWVEAMHENGYDVPFDKVRPLIGMGGDKVLPETIGKDKDSEVGQRISKRRSEIFMQQLYPHLRAFPGASELIQRIRAQGLQVGIASSAQPDELKALLKLIGADDLIEEKTSSQDVSSSKPNPDVMHVTLKRLNLSPDQAVMIGDTAYDIEAARKVGVSTIAFRCGGWSDADLAGALAIYDGPADLLAHFDNSPLTQ